MVKVLQEEAVGEDADTVEPPRADEALCVLKHLLLGCPGLKDASTVSLRPGQSRQRCSMTKKALSSPPTLDGSTVSLRPGLMPCRMFGRVGKGEHAGGRYDDHVLRPAVLFQTEDG